MRRRFLIYFNASGDDWRGCRVLYSSSLQSSVSSSSREISLGGFCELSRGVLLVGGFTTSIWFRAAAGDTCFCVCGPGFFFS